MNGYRIDEYGEHHYVLDAEAENAAYFKFEPDFSGDVEINVSVTFDEIEAMKDGPCGYNSTDAIFKVSGKELISFFVECYLKPRVIEKIKKINLTDIL